MQKGYSNGMSTAQMLLKAHANNMLPGYEC